MALENEKNQNEFNFISLKPLPRDTDGYISRYFTANNRRYKICGIDEISSFDRYTNFERMSIMAAFGMDFGKMYEHLSDLERKVLEVDTSDIMTKTPAILKIQQIKKGVLDTGNARWDYKFYFATLFIVVEGEDMRTWSQEEAAMKINDWNTEGYNATDFFDIIDIYIRGMNDKKKESLKILNLLSDLSLL